ncbi:MAG: peptidoglycan DD-metalloendopeptidase family protein [Moorellaceae bacterium]
MPPHFQQAEWLQTVKEKVRIWSHKGAEVAVKAFKYLRDNLEHIQHIGRQHIGRTLYRAEGEQPVYRRKAALIVLAGALILFGVWRWAVAPNAWAVVIGGEKVAVVAKREDAEKALAKLLEAMDRAGYQGVQLAQQIEYVPVRADREQIKTGDELEQLLATRTTLKALAVELKINGVPRALLRDEASAQAVLEQLKKDYLPGDGAVVEEVKFKEDVSLDTRLASPEEITPAEQVLNLLKGGVEENSQYTVQAGDSLWSIAQKYGLTVEKLKEANPQLQGERLDIGQVINLRQKNPLIHVVVVYRQEVAESIPYETEVRSNSDLWRGEERVKQAGSEGEKKTTYRLVAENGQVVQKEVLTTEVVKNPVTRIVERGTKMRVALASRGGGGSGRLAWPVYGPISSPFGYRGREFHSGMDISASYGTPVAAAESGVVIGAGYEGGYGRLITIDHGGGLVTRYAHLSAYNVRVGQTVARGEVIGYVGTSGRTTGPHLHFEVLIGGEFRNPYNYLR